MKSTDGEVGLEQMNRRLITGAQKKGMRMGFAKFVGWLDKPRNGNEISHDELNFPNYACDVGKLSVGDRWKKILW